MRGRRSGRENRAHDGRVRGLHLRGRAPAAARAARQAVRTGAAGAAGPTAGCRARNLHRRRPVRARGGLRCPIPAQCRMSRTTSTTATSRLTRRGSATCAARLSCSTADTSRQQTIAKVRMSVSLPRHFKGAHLSRFVEVLNAHRGEVTVAHAAGHPPRARDALEADRARVEVVFPYFLERTAPVSGASALMDYECSFVAESNDRATTSCSASRCR